MSPDCFETLPLKERWFVKGRLASAPLAVLAERAPEGWVADIGCGHGALLSLLMKNPQRRLLGVDPDGRKIEWARASVGRFPQVTLKQATLEQLLPEHAGALDGIVVADVLYLLPDAAIADFLNAAYRLLKPEGRLLVKETEADGSWKHYKCLAQEWLMVKGLGRTLGSGGLRLLSADFLRRQLENAGFTYVRSESLHHGYTSPHILFEAAKP